MNQSTPTTGTPTIVLVHGGFADGTSSWSGVIDRLQGAGLTTLAPANPQRGIDHDSAYVSNVVRTIDGPVLLVGHSYGGIVITNVGAQVDNAIGLVYVAGMAPDEGEAMLDVAADYPQTLILGALRPASIAASEAEADFIIDPAQYRAAFAADLPEEQTRVLAATQRPFVGAALATPSGPAAWKTLPSWFAVATVDQAIHPDQQRFYAKRMGATTIEVDASHSIMVSQAADDRGTDPRGGGRPGLTPFPAIGRKAIWSGSRGSPTSVGETRVDGLLRRDPDCDRETFRFVDRPPLSLVFGFHNSPVC